MDNEIKKPSNGLKRRLGYLSGKDRLERKSLLESGFKYVTKDMKAADYDTAAYKKLPILFQDVYISENGQRTLTECFDFLKPGDILKLRTMEILRCKQ